MCTALSGHDLSTISKAKLHTVLEFDNTSNGRVRRHVMILSLGAFVENNASIADRNAAVSGGNFENKNLCTLPVNL